LYDIESQTHYLLRHII